MNSNEETPLVHREILQYSVASGNLFLDFLLIIFRFVIIRLSYVSPAHTDICEIISNTLDTVFNP